MKTYIAFLRGINVGGHRRLPMQELRNLLESLNYKEVKTYIQSGNAVFNVSNKKHNKIEQEIKDAILKRFEYDVPVLVKTPSEIKSILSNCPFSEEKKINSHFILLHTQPLEEEINMFKIINYPNEEIFLKSKCVYLFCNKGYHKAKCNNNFIEKKLKVSATARNYRTISKILEIANTKN